MSEPGPEVPVTEALELRGPRGVRHRVIAHLRADLPVRIAATRAAWGLSEEQLPVPVSAPDDPLRDAYFEREPNALDRWPMVWVSTSRRRQSGQRDTDEAGNPVYFATYATRVFSWVNDPGWDRAQDMRDDLATTITASLLSNITLGSPGASLQIRPETMTIEFSEVKPVRGERFVAGSFVGVDLLATEILSDRLALPGGQPRDTVATVNAAATVLPRAHPAL